MNTQHTPGPWTIIDDLEATLHNESPGRIESVIEVGNRDEGRTACYATNIEDARLIKAAPDLLAALDDMVKAFNVYAPKDDSGGEYNCVIAARAAIAKATGVHA
jgi:hypothetical protein